MINKILKLSLVITLLSSLALFAPTQVSGLGVNGNEKVKVLIGFKNKPGKSEKALIKALGGEVRYAYEIIPTIAASLPEAAIANLERNPNVTMIEPDVTVYANDELANTWGVDRIEADLVQAAGNTGAGVKVAVIDSGIDIDHPDLAANYKGGYDFVNKDKYPDDDYGHGTHVAGTIAAEANGMGVIGVAPEAEIYALKVLGSSGSGNFSDVIAALQWCFDNEIQVTNNSYGSSTDPGYQVEDAFDKLYEAGIINIASAGNEGNRPGAGDNVGYPANYGSVVAVAATDRDNDRAYFSSTGNAVEVSAPGVDIRSTVPGGGYASYNGTSMASPHVAGTAALIIKSGITDPLAIRSVLQLNAIDLGSTGWDSKYGYGLIDAYQSVPISNTAPTVEISQPASGITVDEGTSVSFNASALDNEDGNLTTEIIWESDLDGTIGRGGSFTSNQLSSGAHEITAQVTDGGGLIGQDTITVNITPDATNTAPTVEILNPINGMSFNSGETISFEAEATDVEEGNLTDELIWESDLDGIIGSSGAFTTNQLSVGTHTIIASVTDSGGLTGSASITIFVSSVASVEDHVQVESITYATTGGRNNDAHLLIYVYVIDEADNPVAGADVLAELFGGTSLVKTYSGITDAQGIVSFKLPNVSSGVTYTTEIVDVIASGYIFDGMTPENSFSK